VIAGYSDHAANERTFLAWIRTGIAVIAFGLVIEKFNLFVTTIANSPAGRSMHRFALERLAEAFGRYDGLAFIFSGVGIVVLATMRFVRTARRLNQPEEYATKSVRAELVLASVLVLLVASYSIYLGLD
jgi:putative membrane protein